MKETKLKVGDIYQKPKTLDVRTIWYIRQDKVFYSDIGSRRLKITKKSFRRWLSRNKIDKPIGRYNFEKGKAGRVKK